MEAKEKCQRATGEHLRIRHLRFTCTCTTWHDYMYDLIIDHHSYTQNLRSGELKPEKSSGLNVQA